jgi:hypothetical protein
MSRLKDGAWVGKRGRSALSKGRLRLRIMMLSVIARSARWAAADRYTPWPPSRPFDPLGRCCHLRRGPSPPAIVLQTPFHHPPAWPQNAGCIEGGNLISDWLATLAARARFFTSGGTLVFTILTILKPTRKITSEKTGRFSALRCVAMKNYTPGKIQNNAPRPDAGNPKNPPEQWHPSSTCRAATPKTSPAD